MLDFALCRSEFFLPTPRSIHEFIVSPSPWSMILLELKRGTQYELVQTSTVLKKQFALLQAVGLPQILPNRRASVRSDDTSKVLGHMLSVVNFYSNLIARAGSQSAKEAMKVVAKDVEKDGIFLGSEDSQEPEERL